MLKFPFGLLEAAIWLKYQSFGRGVLPGEQRADRHQDGNGGSRHCSCALTHFFGSSELGDFIGFSWEADFFAGRSGDLTLI